MRQSRDSNLSHFYIHNWKTFREIWKNTEFTKQFMQPVSSDNTITQVKLNKQQIHKLVIQKLQQLIADDKCLCYVFPDTMNLQHVQLIISCIKGDNNIDKFVQQLQFEYQALYYGQKKQLLVYRKGFRSLTSYLSKYRLPTKHKQLYQLVNKTYQNMQEFIINRNIAISLRKNKQQVNKHTAGLQENQKKVFKPALNKYTKFMKGVIQDFVRQQKKQQIMIDKVNTAMRSQLVQICKNYENIRVMDRYFEQQSQVDVKDIIIMKHYQNQISDNSLNSSCDSDLIQQQANTGANNTKQPKLTRPKCLHQVNVVNFKKQGIVCQAQIKKWGLLNKPTHIKVSIRHPQSYKDYCKLTQLPFANKQQPQNNTKTSKQDLWGQQIKIPLILQPINHGYTEYSIRSMNDIGESEETVVKVWIERQQLQQKQQPKTSTSFRNNMLYAIGNSPNGILINNQTKNNEKLIINTNGQWQKLPIICADFSVSNHAVICNSAGDVAGWGSMYCYTVDQNNTENQQQTEEQNSQVLPFFKPYSVRIQPLSLIFNQNHIRKVSCASGYCLMANKLGMVWSFGVNNFGQLGIGHCDQTVDTSEPTQINGLNHTFITDVTATQSGSSFAIDAKGVGYRWGLNQMSQSPKPIYDSFNNIINFEYENVIITQNTPLMITNKMINDRIKKIVSGKDFSFALTEKNTLYGWGNTQFMGQQKIENAHFQAVNNLCNPILILNNITDISVGPSHCLALKQQGQLVAWGSAAYYHSHEQNMNNGKDKLKKFQKTPEILIKNFSGKYFDCGDQFSVIQTDIGLLKFFGQHQLTRNKDGFKIPGQPLKIQIGDGVVMVMTK